MWNKSPPELQLDNAFVDVWRSRIDLSVTKISEYRSTLADEELKRAEQFTFPNKEEEYVVTRGLLRRTLALVLKQDPASFSFNYSESKNPYLTKEVDSQPVVFNVSHSHGQALVAISLNRKLGVDIEKIRPEIEYEKLSARFFSKAEHKALMQCTEAERVASFFATWTRKEAFLKAVGKGISFGLSEFDVNVKANDPPKMLRTRWDVNDVNNWHMASVESVNSHKATVVADGRAFQLRLWQ
ncbi:MAG: 4'-phosphopantetheinyl transferase superfamily protein [Woeseiaceae bacterium]|nr:4'-phosphopantetheinyl transferase superfamily protein [Woeseiaceae bacterium]